MFIFPLSMWLMSGTSLMRDSRWLLEVVILERYPETLSGSSMWEEARAVKPIIAFSRVRISWDILLRNVVLA